MSVSRIGLLALAVSLGGEGATPVEARARGAPRTKVTEIIVHATGGPSCGSGKVVFSDPGTVQRMKRFFEGFAGVSIHYIVGPDGELAASVPEGQVAVHTRGHNDSSIGIEMINRGDGLETFPEAQIQAMVSLVDGIRRRHGIPIDKVHRHSDVDTSTFSCGGRTVRRKQDPGPAFPWDRFLAELEVAGRQSGERVAGAAERRKR